MKRMKVQTIISIIIAISVVFTMGQKDQCPPSEKSPIIATIEGNSANQSNPEVSTFSNGFYVTGDNFDRPSVQILDADGNLLFADLDLNEKSLSRSFLEAFFPEGITPGTYSLRVTNMNGSSAQQDVTILQGEPGPSGPKGATGAQGEQGIEGAIGPQGDQGPEGSTGLKGPSGATGSQGKQGLDGASGPQGEPGIQGDQGYQGDVGPMGQQGPQGIPGSTGATGPAGVNPWIQQGNDIYFDGNHVGIGTNLIGSILGNLHLKSSSSDDNTNADFVLESRNGNKVVLGHGDNGVTGFWDPQSGRTRIEIEANGNVYFDGDIKVNGLNDGVGKIVCNKGGGTLGTCFNQPSNGICTCQ